MVNQRLHSIVPMVLEHPACRRVQEVTDDGTGATPSPSDPMKENIGTARARCPWNTTQPVASGRAFRRVSGRLKYHSWYLFELKINVRTADRGGATHEVATKFGKNVYVAVGDSAIRINCAMHVMRLQPINQGFANARDV